MASFLLTKREKEMAREISKVVVIGGGEMGRGISQLVAQKGVQAVVKEINDERAQACKNAVVKQLDKISRVGVIDKSEAERTKSRFSVTSSYDGVRDADLVIEAVFEDMEVKKAVFREIDSLFPEHVIFATNSSSLSITEIASVTGRPDRFIGMHFFNPAPSPSRALVELVRGEKTSDETHSTAERFVKVDLQKTPATIKGCPGYLVNRMLMPYLNEAAHLLTETILTVRQIDARIEKFGLPMGPFALLDFVGIDIAAKVAEILYKGYGERAKPVSIMRKLVEAGRIGKKSGAGFYVGDSSSDFEDIQVLLGREYPGRQAYDIERGFKRMMAGFRNEAFLCLQEGIALPDIIDKGAVLGIGFPMVLEGPLHDTQDRYGFANFLSDLREFERECGARFKPAEILVELVAGNKKIFEKVEEEEW
ncbi:MAG: 30S ribosomal protein S20 [Candidatus Yanofskybacteria bacterium]|nr:30S ribosomal protein S20 [Candidatus Yanofskybacteria bacterium]